MTNPFRSTPIKKINLAYLGESIVMDVRGIDTVTAQLRNVYSGDMVAATLTNDVSMDGVDWVSGLFPGQDIVTAAGTQVYTGQVINVQGYAFYRLAVSAKAGSDRWVLVSLHGKVNTTK